MVRFPLYLRPLFTERVKLSLIHIAASFKMRHGLEIGACFCHPKVIYTLWSCVYGCYVLEGFVLGVG